MKVYIHTHGCTNNFYESEVIKGLLVKNKLELVKKPEEADINIINICTVKGIDTALRTIKNIKQIAPEKKIVITGCISKDIIPKIRRIDENIPLVNTHNITSIVEIIEELHQDNVMQALVRTKEDKINLPKVYLNKVIGIVPIATGCVDYCSYCSVKLIKGHIYSYPQEKILKEVERNINQGCKEIWITSQDNGAYGLDYEEYKLIDLMKKILKIKGDFKVRLGMINPHHALKMIDGLIEILQDEKMFKFIHLPIESGNNEILALMKRKYNIFEYKEMVEKLRRNIKDITIATDIIVGFPTETELQFHDSLQLISDLKPEVLNRSKFHARPNTKAEKMEQVTPEEIKQRSRELSTLYENLSFQNNKKWLNWEGEIIIDGRGKNNTYVGRNFAYKQVVLKGNFHLGQKAKVRITNTTIFDLRGEVVE